MTIEIKPTEANQICDECSKSIEKGDSRIKICGGVSKTVYNAPIVRYVYFHEACFIKSIMKLLKIKNSFRRGFNLGINLK